MDANQLFQQAINIHQQGNLAEAQRMYLEVLESDPEHIDATHCLGVSKLQQGDLKQAVELIQKTTHLNPQYFVAFSNLGQAYTQMGETKKAIEALAKSIEINPEYGEARGNLALAYLQQGELEQAEQQFRESIRCNPNLIENYSNLANTLAQLGKPLEAIEQFSKALQFNGDNIFVISNLGKLYREQGYTQKAIDCYSHMIRSNPKDASAFLGLGLAFSDARKYQEAELYIIRALSLSPNSVEILYNLADLYEKSNRLEEAETFSTKCLSLSKNYLPALRVHASILRRQKRYDEALDLLKNIEVDKREHDIAAGAFHERAKIHQQLNDLPQALGDFEQCNNLLMQRYDPEGRERKKYQNFLKRQVKFYQKANKQKVETSCLDAPAFILGFPRSGTTLLDQILSAHPNITVSDEQPFIFNLLKELPGGQKAYPGNLQSLSESNRQELRQLYYGQMNASINLQPGQLFVDKFPLNTAQIDLIYHLFPEAKIIFVQRHPADVCLSSYQQYFGIDPITMNFLTLKDTTVFYKNTLKLYQAYERVFPINVQKLRYEELVSNPEKILRELLSFLGLAWNDSLLQHQEHLGEKERISTVSYEAVTEPIHERAKYKWQAYKEWLDPHFKRLEAEAKALDYEI